MTGGEMIKMFRVAELTAQNTDNSNVTFGARKRVEIGIEAYLNGVEQLSVPYFERANNAALGGNHTDEMRWNYLARAYEAGRRGQRFTF